NEPGKAIQIHHIDGNPSNHSASNLAVGRYNRSEITLGRSSRITPKELLDGQLSMAERHCSGAATSSWQGRNHHNFDEHPRLPKVGREASPRRRVCRIDPLVPNRIVIFEQAHVSDPDLGA